LARWWSCRSRFARRRNRRVAEFFSFGTNDLTQTVMGLSRDDAGRFLPDYVDEKKAGIFPAIRSRRWTSRALG